MTPADLIERQRDRIAPILAITHGHYPPSLGGPKSITPTGKGGRQPRPIRCVETGEVYPSRYEAAKALDVMPTSVHVAACYGKRLKGFHFEFVKGKVQS